MNGTQQWIAARGTFLVEPKLDRISVGLGHDFINLYAWFLEENHKARYSYSKFGAHITVALKKIHGRINYDAARQFHGEKILFEYDPDFVTGGKRSGVPNYWLRVRSVRIDEIKKVLNIRDDAGFGGLHVTIASQKLGVRKFQRRAIEIV